MPYVSSLLVLLLHPYGGRRWTCTALRGSADSTTHRQQNRSSSLLPACLSILAGECSLFVLFRRMPHSLAAQDAPANANAARQRKIGAEGTEGVEGVEGISAHQIAWYNNRARTRAHARYRAVRCAIRVRHMRLPRGGAVIRVTRMTAPPVGVVHRCRPGTVVAAHGWSAAAVGCQSAVSASVSFVDAGAVTWLGTRRFVTCLSGCVGRSLSRTS